MCNLYSTRHTRAEMGRVFRAERAKGDNANSDISVFPDRLAPVIIAKSGDRREIVEMRWGFPPPPQGNALVTNVRNTASPFWRPWLKPEQRCLVPVARFCEWTDAKPKRQVWFGLDSAEPLFAFAGIWRPWSGTRGTKKEPVDGEHLIFSFLTCAPNEIVASVHAKAMPVVLASDEDFATWLNAPADIALQLQRPFPGLTILD